MTDQENIVNVDKIVFDDNNRKKIMVLFGTNLFQTPDFIFVPTFGHFVEYVWLLLKS